MAAIMMTRVFLLSIWILKVVLSDCSTGQNSIETIYFSQFKPFTLNPRGGVSEEDKHIKVFACTDFLRVFMVGTI